MNNICPFMTTFDMNRNICFAPCRSDCALYLGVDCALKVIGVSALKKIRSANAKPNKKTIADKPKKE